MSIIIFTMKNTHTKFSYISVYINKFRKNAKQDSHTLG